MMEIFTAFFLSISLSRAKEKTSNKVNPIPSATPKLEKKVRESHWQAKVSEKKLKTEKKHMMEGT